MSEIREALNAAFGSDGAQQATEPTAQVTTPPPVEAPAVETPTIARGPDGKFATKLAETQQKPAPVANEEAKSQEPLSTVAPDVKAPQSWKPALREKWASLSPDVREEVIRREREVSVALSQSAEARRTAEAFTKAIAPYRGTITGEPMAVVGNLLQTAHALQTGTPQSKAAIVAQIVRGYGVPIEALDAALSGHGQAAQQQEFRDPRLDRLLEQAERTRQQQAMHSQQEMAKQIADFAAKHEFFADVRDTMADIAELRTRQGVEITLEDAYALALKMHPEISVVIAQREAAKAAATQVGATQRAVNASSSVRNEAAPTVAAQPDTLRGAVEAAMSKYSAR